MFIERSPLQGCDAKFLENFLLTNGQTQRAIASLFPAGFVRRGLDNRFRWSVQELAAGMTALNDLKAGGYGGRRRSRTLIASGG